ncbi:MAG: S-adenosylmethionine:tRNA ribosyltransferase-isomerase [Ferruginibacter sp.]
MTHPKEIMISDYTYELPESKIALVPSLNRENSRLLIYKNQKISVHTFKNLSQYLPTNSLLIFNNTKVINARLQFQKASGGVIEIFFLQPDVLSGDYSRAMSDTGSVRWKALVGGASKWKGKLEKNVVISGHPVKLTVLKIEKQGEHYVVEMEWYPGDLTFAEILQGAGEIPLPPYIKRKSVESDKERYQTIYADLEGSVAAPTAGLHFTPQIFRDLAERHIQIDFVTLHVGAGTFKPVKTKTLAEHQMHAEWISVDLNIIRNLLANLGKVTAVGTTSVRTIESLYWMGVKIILHPKTKDLTISQWMVYEDNYMNTNITPEVSLNALLQWLHDENLDRIVTATQLLIAPGYTFKLVNAIITNFHQPFSTLLLLIAAAAGNDWKKIYNYALNNNFRFLSFGDSNLIFID